MPNRFNFSAAADRQRQLVDLYAERLTRLYETAVDALARASAGEATAEQVFSFGQNPRLRVKADALFSGFARDWLNLVSIGTGKLWDEAEGKNDQLVGYLAGLVPLNRAMLTRYNARNLEALAAYQNRLVKGLPISQRIWNYTGQFRAEMELALDRSIGEGVSAQKVSQRVRTLLHNPDLLFRRVRDERGALVMSTRMAQFKPGAGVYRSSYKNAMRLTRTEINNAYREADYVRWQALDVVVGIEVRRSNTPGECPICPKLVGRYPKTFRFNGWHPQCRCYAIPVLVSESELARLNAADEAELPLPTDSQNRVSETPDGFRDWVQQNRPRWQERGGAKPTFLDDNDEFDAAPPRPLLETLREAGYAITETEDRLASAYSAFRGFDLVGFKSEFMAIMDKAKIQMDAPKVSVGSGGSLIFSFEGQDAWGKPLYLERTLFMQEGKRWVEHNYFEVPRSMQGGGISKEVFAALYKQYRSAGIDVLSVHANIDVGGYAWARYGFTFKNQADRRMVLNLARLKLKGEDLADFQRTWAAIKDEPIFPMQAIAKKSWGKTLLLKSDWYGVIDLQNAEARQLFEDYLFAR